MSLSCLLAALCADAQELQVTVPQRVRISQGVSQSLLIKKVAPDYPPEARSRLIEGRVVFKAFIDKRGDVERLYPIAGHDLLVPAAMKAVKQWKYKPYLFQGQPIEVETQITVPFTIGGH